VEPIPTVCVTRRFKCHGLEVNDENNFRAFAREILDFAASTYAGKPPLHIFQAVTCGKPGRRRFLILAS
jgi:hypothetical protein